MLPLPLQTSAYGMHPAAAVAVDLLQDTRMHPRITAAEQACAYRTMEAMRMTSLKSPVAALRPQQPLTRALLQLQPPSLMPLLHQCSPTRHRKHLLRQRARRP